MVYNRFLNTAVLACGLTCIGTAIAQEPDNTKTNKDHATTADNQKMNVNDRELTQKIRKAVVADMIDGTIAANRLEGQQAEEWRRRLWSALEANPGLMSEAA